MPHLGCDIEPARLTEPAVDLELLRAPGLPSETAPRSAVRPEPLPDSSGAGEAAGASHDPWEQGMSFLTVGGDEVSTVSAPRYEVRHHPEVQRQVERYLVDDRKRGLQQWLGRSGRYAEMIQGVLRDHGLPEDLFVKAMIESGFNPAAASHAGAKGLWQFMAATARQYGLRVDHWVDERLDPEKSTRAAARYLRDLYATFGSWLLVHAAYNTGEFRVARALLALRTGDFWELCRSSLLSEETMRFVASVQAAVLIVRNPERYGLSMPVGAPAPYQTMEVPSGTSLAELAGRAGVDAAVLHELNLDLTLGQTPPDRVHRIKVPVELVSPIRVALEADGHRANGGAKGAAPTRGRSRPDPSRPSGLR